MGIILVKRGFKIEITKKIILTKNVFLNSYSLLKKKRKIRMIFDIEKIHFESPILALFDVA